MASSSANSSKNLAFHQSLTAYDFNCPERIPNQKLAVKEFVKATPDLRPTQAELSPNDDELTGLWVGMRPSVKPQIRYPRFDDNGRVKPNSDFQTIKHDLNALRVIARVNKSSTLYYCLGDQENDICTAYHTFREEVFLFEEYRDDTVYPGISYHKVREACKAQEGIFQNRGNSLTAKPEPSPARNTDVETSMLGSAIGATNNSLEETGSVEVGRTTLYKLATSNTALSLQECESAIQELYIFAPDMQRQSLKPRDIQGMSEGLVQSKLVLDFRLLHDYIILYLRYVQDGTGKSKEDLATQAQRNALLMYGWTVGRATISTDSFSRYLMGEINKHQEFLDSAVLFATHALRVNQQGIARYLQSEVEGLEEHVKRLKELRSILPQI